MKDIPIRAGVDIGGAFTDVPPGVRRVSNGYGTRQSAGLMPMEAGFAGGCVTPAKTSDTYNHIFQEKRP